MTRQEIRWRSIAGNLAGALQDVLEDADDQALPSAHAVTRALWDYHKARNA